MYQKQQQQSMYFAYMYVYSPKPIALIRKCTPNHTPALHCTAYIYIQHCTPALRCILHCRFSKLLIDCFCIANWNANALKIQIRIAHNCCRLNVCGQNAMCTAKIVTLSHLIEYKKISSGYK